MWLGTNVLSKTALALKRNFEADSNLARDSQFIQRGVVFPPYKIFTFMFDQIFDLLSPFLGPFFISFSKIEIENESRDHLVLNVNSRRIIFNKRSQTVSSSGQVLTSFRTIASIDIDRCVDEDDGVYYAVCLRQAGRRSIEIGRTKDEVQASIAAAHISTITGKEVRAF